LAQILEPGSVIVEIGTYRGRSTVALALGAKSGQRNAVFAVDPHCKFKGLYGGSFGPEDQAQLYRNLSRCSVGDLVHVVSLPSEQVAATWKTRNIGLLWLDG